MSTKRNKWKYIEW